MLSNDTESQWGHSVSCMNEVFFINDLKLKSMLANHQTRHQASRKVGCQTGDCRWSLNLPQYLCGYVWTDILTLSLLKVKSSSIHISGRWWWRWRWGPSVKLWTLQANPKLNLFTSAVVIKLLTIIKRCNRVSISWTCRRRKRFVV